MPSMCNIGSALKLGCLTEQPRDESRTVGRGNRNARDRRQARRARNPESCYEIRQAKQQPLASAVLEQLTDGRSVCRRRRELSRGARLMFAQGEAAIARGEHRVLPGGE